MQQRARRFYVVKFLFNDYTFVKCCAFKYNVNQFIRTIIDYPINLLTYCPTNRLTDKLINRPTVNLLSVVFLM